MRTRLLDATAVSRELTRMIEEHARIHVAVAWGAMTEATQVLLANRAKFQSILVGVDFAATDPDLVDELVGVKNSYVAVSRGGCFHPKIYYFETDQKAEAIVGSSNLTPGGMSVNQEACVFVAGDRNEQIFADIRRQMASYSKLKKVITPELAASYRRQALAAAAKPRPKRPVLPGDGKPWTQVNSALAALEWTAFVREVRDAAHHDFEKRMQLLRRVQAMLAAVGSFASLSVSQWKAIAGVIGDVEKAEADLDGFDWGWFGSMGGSGVFAKAVGRRSDKLAQAMDSIPPHDRVTREHFERFCENFTEAFAGESRTGRIATASRLLAMKRPDSFVCVNEGNKAGMAEALAFPRTTLSLQNYWERVVEPIRASPWYNAPRPARRDRELWDYRVAMLDAIYYEPL